MDQEKFGKLIKELRKKNNLTQKQLADKYNVTYQAVSKWENGKNMPDTYLIKQIGKDFNIPLEDLLNGEYKIKKRNILLIGIIVILIILVIVCLFIVRSMGSSFEFRTLSSSCHDFDITGSLAYNQNKSSIYISNIEYCSDKDDTLYKNIKCVLYESNGNTDTKIEDYHYEIDTGIKLEDYLKGVSIHVDNYDRVCDDYLENTLYLSISATDLEDRVTSYKVPLSIKDNCLK